MENIENGRAPYPAEELNKVKRRIAKELSG